jgi:acyl carrier protein
MNDGTANPELITRVSEIASDHFNQPGLSLSRDKTASDIEGWDSIAHIQLMMRLEEEFGIRFKTAEVSAVNNVGALVDRIRDLLK